jgi:hypothetical protein
MSYFDSDTFTPPVNPFSRTSPTPEASARYARFSSDFVTTDQLDWTAIRQTDWRDPVGQRKSYLISTLS